MRAKFIVALARAGTCKSRAKVALLWLLRSTVDLLVFIWRCVKESVGVSFGNNYCYLSAESLD